jgi:hypothetical protein
MLKHVDFANPVGWLGARDTLGKVWKVPGRQLRLIRQEENARLGSAKSLKG